MRSCAFLLASLLAAAAAADEVAWPALGSPKVVGGGEKDAALIAGADRYAFVERVPGSGELATAWGEYLVQGRRVPADRVRVLRDQEVTAEKLLRFAAEAANQVEPGGTLWFVFIGHGFPGGLLVGVDAQAELDSVQQRSVPQAKILEALSQGRAGRVVAVVDACFSGRAPSGKPIIERLQPLVIEAAPKVEDRLTVLTAAAPNEYAGPLKGISGPAFSYLVLGGLRGWADADADGKVTAGELRAYAGRALRLLATDRVQNPTLRGEATAVLGNAYEKGPDLAALSRGDAANRPPSELAMPTLPPLPAKIPIEALEAFDRAVKLEKVGAPAEIVGEWGSLAQLKGENPYRPYAEKKEKWWAAALHEAPRAWEKLKRLVDVGVVSADDKDKALQHFRTAFGSIPGYPRRVRDLTAALRNARECAAGKQRGCAGLGWAYHRGRGVVRDDEKARKRLQDACEADEPLGCAGLAHLYEKGVSVPQRLDEALSLYERACKRKLPRACVAAAWMRQHGAGGAAKPDAGLKVYRAVCKKGEAVGCQRLGESLLRKSDARAQAGARKALDKACRKGALRACTTLAWTYAEGKGVTRDVARARGLYLEACERGDLRACFKLGEMYFYGNGTEVNRTRSYALFESACEGGDAPSCASMGWTVERMDQDYPKARDLYESSCRDGALHGCVALGRMLEHGRGVVKDGKRAFELYRRACEGNDRWGCKKLGDAYMIGAIVRQDSGIARKTYERACELGEPRGCFHVALYKQDESPLPPAKGRVVAELFEKACAGGVMRGCDDLARMYDVGDGLTKDVERARGLYRKSCDSYLARSCYALADSFKSDPLATPTEKAEAGKLLQRACSMGLRAACPKRLPPRGLIQPPRPTHTPPPSQ